MFINNIEFSDNKGVQIEFNGFKFTTPYNTLYIVKDNNSYVFYNKDKPLFSCTSFTVNGNEGTIESFCNTFYKKSGDCSEIQELLDAANANLQMIYNAYDTNFGTTRYPSSNSPDNVVGGMQRTNNDIYNALVTKGSTPATKHLEDYPKAINNISSKAYVVDGMKFRCYGSNSMGYPEDEVINFSNYDFSKLSDGIELFGSVNYGDMTNFDKCTGVIDIPKQYMRINYMLAGCKLTKNFRKLFKNFNFISNSFMSNSLFKDAWIVVDSQNDIDEFFNSFTIGSGDYMFQGMRLKKNIGGTDFSGASIPINFDYIYLNNALTGQPATTLQLKGYSLNGEINSFGAATKIQIDDTLDMSNVYYVDLVETGITSLIKSGTTFQNSMLEDIWPTSLCSQATDDCTIIMEGYTDYWNTVANNICTKTSGNNVIQTSSSDINNINIYGLADTFTLKGWTITERH